MIGFFEHQYLSYKKNHLRNLLALARADGTLHPREEELLFRLGQRYGLKERQIRAIVESDEPVSVKIPQNHHDRMNQICDLLLMIYADEKVDANEVAFVEDAVQKFGMKKEIVPWMLGEFQQKGMPPAADDWEDMKLVAQERFLQS